MPRSARVIRARILQLVLLAVSGCCRSEISGGELSGATGVQGATGTTGGANGGLSPSSGSVAGSASSGTGGGTGSATGTSGGSTGVMTVAPLLLLDAGLDTVFGPVAIAAVPEPSGSGAAKLVYSAGDGGQYGVTVRTLAGNGSPLGSPTPVAATNVSVYTEDGLVYISPASPPAVTIADDGQQTSICWEDWGLTSNVDAGCLASVGPLVQCAELDDVGGSPTASYSSCGGSPQLVRGQTAGLTELFYALYDPIGRTDLVNWRVGQDWDAARRVTTHLEAPVGLALPSGEAGAVYASLITPTGGNLVASGLYLAQVDYSNGNFSSDHITAIEPGYQSQEQLQNVFTAAGDPGAPAVGVLEFQEGVVTELAWNLEARTSSTAATLSAPVPLIGAIAAGVCPGAFAYFALTARDTVFFIEATFDGGLLPATAKFVSLGNFNQTPGLVRLNNIGWAAPSTSLAVAPAPGGNLFLAISNPAQVAVYLVDCE